MGHLLAGLMLACCAAANAEPPAMADFPAAPLHLPRYNLEISLDTAAGIADVRQRVEWTNPGPAPTQELVFHCYPRHRPTAVQKKLYQRTLESLRVDPRDALDEEGRRLDLHGVWLAGQPLQCQYEAEKDTVLHVALPAPVPPGATVAVDLAFRLRLPPVQGRCGQWRGVTTLANWHPLLACYGPHGWDAPPFVGWHQPWLNEAGHYDATLRLQRGETVATGAEIVSDQSDGAGGRCVRLRGCGLRDLALAVSRRYEVWEQDVDGVRLRVAHFPQHRGQARVLAHAAAAALRQFRDWIGPYPYPTLTVAEAYFGWNGNETGGMVLIDERIFDAPAAAGLYLEQLVTHEIAHQWWYGVVGTDGYRESWVDESLAVYLNRLALEARYGRNRKLFAWEKPLAWLPNISQETLAHSGYYTYLGHGGHGAPLQDLDGLGHLHNLFFLVYDRGARVQRMIHHRLGDEGYFRALRLAYRRHAFGVMRAADFQKALEDSSGESWDAFFCDWLKSPKVADWKVERVRRRGGATEIIVRQAGELAEPVEIAAYSRRDGAPAVVLTLPAPPGAPLPGGATAQPIDARSWCVQLPWEAERVEIDPDGWVLDSDLQNNSWNRPLPTRFAPLYTPLEEIALAHPLDRWSLVAGPGFIDMDGRIGAKAALLHGSRWRIAPFAAVQLNSNGDAPATAGVEAFVSDFLWPNLSLGARYDRTIGDPLFRDPGDQGKLFLRWNHAYTTSFLIPNVAYTEAYFRFGDNFYPDPDLRPPTRPGVEDYRDVRALGLAFHLNTMLPYWNPSQGESLDVAAEWGFRGLGGGESFQRVWGQAAAVRRLPRVGILDDWRLAGRVAGGVGSPDNGEHFRFGGPQRFRGQRSEDTEGSAFWLATGELRFPLRRDLDWPVAGRLATIRGVYAAAFAEVGDCWLQGQSLGMDTAVGGGLHWQLSMLSFVEAASLRLEYGRSLRTGSDVLWFGLNTAF